MPNDVAISHSDIVIVGGGVAGLSAALAARGRSVTMLAKAPLSTGSSTALAQGGIAVALGSSDSPAEHADDTLAAGAGLCDPAVVAAITDEGPRRIRQIISRGTRFDREPDGDLLLGREAAHSRRRIVHASGDATGAELVRALSEAILREKRISLDDNVFALDLILDNGRVIGLTAIDDRGHRRIYLAGAVILATGGIGQLYAHTTNPSMATGDGLAMAARAGARLKGLELIQFHPTALADGSNPQALLTEALRGEGAIIVDETGHRFLQAIHPDAELAPRDVVARAIWRHSDNGHQVFLDARTITSTNRDLSQRFPTVFRLCAEKGLDPSTHALPISPAAHYHMGGISIDLDGRSSIDGLWACGEVSHSGLHGANRLASNSLLEGLVIGSRLGEALARPQPLTEPSPNLSTVAWPTRPARLADDAEAAEIATEIRQLMWHHVGLERSETSLTQAEAELHRLAATNHGQSTELSNMLTVAHLVAQAARLRTESRGAHYRTDFPFSDHHWQQDLEFDGLQPVPPRPLDLPQVAAV